MSANTTNNQTNDRDILLWLIPVTGDVKGKFSQEQVEMIYTKQIDPSNKK